MLCVEDATISNKLHKTRVWIP